jgi:hypothetical protein
MRHDEAYSLMMEALDGELSDTGRLALDEHLEGCHLCSREWQALLAIEALFRQAPALSPAAGFAGRTLARLPESSYRIWWITALYGLLLLSGLIPVAVLAWLGVVLIPAIREPALIRSIGRSIDQLLPAIGAVLGAIWHGVLNAGELVGENPAIVGWLLILAGIVWVWGSVYSRLLAQPGRMTT